MSETTTTESVRCMVLHPDGRECDGAPSAGLWWVRFDEHASGAIRACDAHSALLGARDDDGKLVSQTSAVDTPAGLRVTLSPYVPLMRMHPTRAEWNAKQGEDEDERCGGCCRSRQDALVPCVNPRHVAAERVALAAWWLVGSHWFVRWFWRNTPIFAAVAEWEKARSADTTKETSR